MYEVHVQKKKSAKNLKKSVVGLKMAQRMD